MSTSTLRTSARRGSVIAAAVAVVAASSVATVAPAQAQLREPVGAPDAQTGFPSWYEDFDGIKVKLCVDNAMCLGGDPRPDTTRPASVHTGNLPDEAFYAVARAEATLHGGGRIRWRAVVEGAFANEEVVHGDQMTFTRTQVVGSKINLTRYPAGSPLTFKTPYGTMTGLVKKDGTLERARKESAAGTVDNNFLPPTRETTILGLQTRFLRWDTGAPAGFLGNPTELHTITGGTNNYNKFQVFQGAVAVSDEVTEFEVAGQKAS